MSAGPDGDMAGSAEWRLSATRAGLQIIFDDAMWYLDDPSRFEEDGFPLSQLLFRAMFCDANKEA